MRSAPHRSTTAAALDRIAELELTVDTMGRKLLEVERERDELRTTLDNVNEGMRRRIERMQADRLSRAVRELLGAGA